MREQRSIRLFKRGTAPEVRLAVFVVLSVVLLITDARWTVLEPARQALAMAIYPFQRVAMAPATINKYVDTWLNATALVHSEKEALQRQRIELAQVSTHAAQLATENEQLRRLLQVADTVTQPAVAVEVFYEPPNAFNRRLVFNKGSTHGIRPGMPVIDEGGVVGQVVRVTRNTAEAALITDDKVSIPVQVLRNGLRLVAFGGHVAAKVEARYLTNEVDLYVGDILVTSGIGGLFPAGLPVAEVESIEFDAATGFAMAVGQPLSHPERYRHFLVLLVDEPAIDLSDKEEVND